MPGWQRQCSEALGHKCGGAGGRGHEVGLGRHGNAGRKRARRRPERPGAHVQRRKFQTGVASQRRRVPLGAAPGRVRISACGRAGGSGSIRSPVLRALASCGRPSSVVVKRRGPQGGARAARVPPVPRGRAAGRRRSGPVWLRGLGGLALPLTADTQGRVTGAWSDAARSEDWLVPLTSLKAEGSPVHSRARWGCRVSARLRRWKPLPPCFYQGTPLPLSPAPWPRGTPGPA